MSESADEMDKRIGLLLLLGLGALMLTGKTLIKKFSQATRKVREVLGYTLDDLETLKKIIVKDLINIKFLGYKVPVNRKAVQAFLRVDQEIKAAEITYPFTIVQTFDFRTKRSNPQSLSHHSFGIAVDINPPTNPMSYTELKSDIPKKVVEIFERNGFIWGGRWTRPIDPMHFEYRVA